ncbi:MAG: TraB/GumN family protein [Vicinamibacterales bacterium]
MGVRGTVAAVVGIGWLLSASADAQTPPARPSPSPTGQHLVWRVAQGPRTVAFLVASIHVLTKAAYPLPEVFDRVFTESGTLVEEVDLGASGDISALLPTAAGALFTDGQTLRTVLDAPTFAQVEAKVAATGMPLALVERMKPWLVAMLLVVPELSRAGFDPAHGLDRHYYDRARAARRTVRGLETAAYQVERLNGLPLPVQVEMLKATLDDVEAQVASVDTIVTAWRRGDLDTLERLLLQSFRESPAIYQRLLVERNRDWVPKIGQCAAEPSPCLVVVGGAHLLGPDGLVTLLTAAGFTLEQM